MNWIFDRLREPSTAAGLGIVAMSLEEVVRTGSWEAGLFALFGAIAAARRG